MSIKIDLKIFLFLAIFLITRQIKIYAILMLFALIHELGHLAMGLMLGLKPENLKVIPAGFSITFKLQCKDYNKKIKNGNLFALKQIIISLAGPLTNLLLVIIAIIYFRITQNTYMFGIPIDLIFYSNLIILIFNLLPIYPLDGGRILKNLLHIFVNLKNAYKITNIITNTSIILLTIISSIFVLYYKNVAILIVMAYLWAIFIRENKIYNARKKLW